MSDADHDCRFEAMGSHVRLLIGEPGPRTPPAELAAAEARRFIQRFEAVLSRFRPGSELCALNADPRPAVPASALMRAAVRAGLEAAQRSSGLVDPSLAREVAAAGYRGSLAGVPGASLQRALAAAPARRPAGPDPRRRWTSVRVDEAAGTVVRPPGLALDSGGVGKGLAADMLADRLEGYRRFVVDCGGDIRIGGQGALLNPFRVLVEHPLSGRRRYALLLGPGGVATSGLNVRIWRRADGSFAHHLIDPATGEPAWTGLIGATALGRTALEAETLSKAAILAGPDEGRRLLSAQGGLLVHDSGEVEKVGPLSLGTAAAGSPSRERPVRRAA